MSTGGVRKPRFKIRPNIERDWVNPSETIKSWPGIRPIRYRSERIRMRRLWESGIPPYSSLFVGWGIITIRKLTNRDGSIFSLCTLRTASGQYRVRWFGNVKPPTVENGYPQVVVGRLGTYNQGSDIILTDAMILNRGRRGGFRQRLTAAFRAHVVAPKQFMDWPDAWIENDLKSKE